MYGEVFNFVKPHLFKSNIELEFRLGKKNSNYFDTNIGKENFEKVHRRLMKYKEWDEVKHQKAVVYYGVRKGLRIVYDEETDEQNVITKYNFAHMDNTLTEQPFDVRVSLAIENPATYDQEKDRFPTVKKRIRTSFIRKGLSIDMSIVENDDKESENPFVYQLEFEILDPVNLSDVTFANHYQKIFDVLKLFV